MLLWGALVATFALCTFGLAALGSILAGAPGGVIGGGIGLVLAATLTVLWLRRRAAEYG